MNFQITMGNNTKCTLVGRGSVVFQTKAKTSVRITDVLHVQGLGMNLISVSQLQDKGYDTVEANHQLGFAADERDFTLCADMFKLLGVNEVRLLTNNPRKVEILSEAGINIVERVPLVVGRNPKNAHYLDTKAEKMGHLLPDGK